MDVPLLPKNLVGTWNATLYVDFSTCAGSEAGDTRQRQWLISYEAQAYILRVLGTGEAEVAEYAGGLDQRFPTKRLRLVSERGASGVVLRFDSEDRLVGQRYVANEDCVIVYEAVAKRVR